jgi:hypothetical protein
MILVDPIFVQVSHAGVIVDGRQWDSVPFKPDALQVGRFMTSPPPWRAQLWKLFTTPQPGPVVDPADLLLDPDGNTWYAGMINSYWQTYQVGAWRMLWNLEISITDANNAPLVPNWPAIIEQSDRPHEVRGSDMLEPSEDGWLYAPANDYLTPSNRVAIMQSDGVSASGMHAAIYDITVRNEMWTHNQVCRCGLWRVRP